MAAVIRLQRGGRKKQPHYSVVVTDKRNPRDGSFIERLGYYDPCSVADTLKLDMERVNYWLSQGAQASPRAAGLISRANSEKLDSVEAESKAEIETQTKIQTEAEAESKAEPTESVESTE